MDTDSKFNLTDSHGNILSMKDVLDASSDSFDNMSIDEKAGCIDLPFEPRERGLFNLCLLVGLNHMTGQAYVKSVFPSQVSASFLMFRPLVFFGCYCVECLVGLKVVSATSVFDSRVGRRVRRFHRHHHQPITVHCWR